MRLVASGMLVWVLGLGLVACGEPDDGPDPGQAVSTHKAAWGDGKELTARFLGTIDGQEVYTLCTGGDRLYFWTTSSGGSMAIHPNDATCKN